MQPGKIKDHPDLELKSKQKGSKRYEKLDNKEFQHEYGYAWIRGQAPDSQGRGARYIMDFDGWFSKGLVFQL